MATAVELAHQQLKEKGAFYTPPSMARFLVSWAVRSATDTVLDPSCGDGEFLVQSIRRLRELGAEREAAAEQVRGIEFDSEAAELAKGRVIGESRGTEPHIQRADFFSCRPMNREYDCRLDASTVPAVDAVVGNPPYIRYHGFHGTVRASAAVAVARHGIRLTDLTSSWAPFVVHATSFLKPRGRLAFVLPGELLYVDYAKAVRDFLSVAYSSVSIIAFNERVFPGVLADTLLVLAEKQGPTSGLSVVRLRNLSELPEEGTPFGAATRVPFNKDDAKWSHLILPPDARLAYQSLTGRVGVSRLGKHFCVDIGVVSGNNDFFVLTQDQLDRSRIPPNEVVPCLSSSRQLLGTRIGKEEFAEMRRSGQKAWLLNLAGKSRLSEAAKGYLVKGTHNGAREGYKVHSRRKWYEVPSVYSPDAFMSYFISEAPRFTVNDVGATSTNTIHRMRRLATNGFDTEMLVLSCYSTVTGLSAEVEGRSYGGGVAKLETKEAENLLVVVPSDASVKELRQSQRGIHESLLGHNPDGAAELVDQILLEGQLGLTPGGIRTLRDGLDALRSRRRSRMHPGATRND